MCIFAPKKNISTHQNNSKMKNLTLIIILVTSLCSAFAQDIIVLRNADEIEAKVQTIGFNDITYKKWDFQDGPSYQIAQSDVLFIKYANGRKELFYNRQTSDNKSSSNEPIYVNKMQKQTPFNVYIEGGTLFSSMETGPAVNFTFGARFSEIFYAGLTTGFDALFLTDGSEAFDAATFPLMLNVRSFIPIKHKYYPFLSLSLGADFMTSFQTEYYYQGNYYYVKPITPAFRFRAGAGFEYKRFTAGLGADFMYFGESKIGVMLGYLQLGVKIGKVN